MSKAKIYSYARISSTKQIDGLGLDIQIDETVLKSLSTIHQLPIADKPLSDVGRSAFKGEHLKNNLGLFLKAVEEDKVGVGSILVVYSLDRLSRQSLGFAKQIYLDLTNNGILIHSVTDNKTFKPHDIESEIFASIIFERAHNESKTKSNRTYDVAIKRANDHINGVRTDDGYSYLISLGNNPWWITNREDKAVVEHPQYFEIARKIYQMILDGWGNNKIINYLNEHYEPPRSFAHGDLKAKYKGWKFTNISKFHKKKSLYGLKEVTIKGKRYELEGFFPAVISRQEWMNLQRIKASRVLASGNRKRHSIITGMGIAKCFHCGASVATGMDKDTGLTRYYCVGNRNYRNGCIGFNMKGIWLESALLDACDIETIQIEEKVNYDPRLLEVENQIEIKREAQEQLIELIGQGIAVKKSADSLKKIQTELHQLDEELNHLRELDAYQQHDQLEDLELELQRWHELKPYILCEKNQDLRQAARDELIRKVIESVEVAKLQQGYCYIFRFKSGKTAYYKHNGRRMSKLEISPIHALEYQGQIYESKQSLVDRLKQVTNSENITPTDKTHQQLMLAH